MTRATAAAREILIVRIAQPANEEFLGGKTRIVGELANGCQARWRGTSRCRVREVCQLGFNGAPDGIGSQAGIVHIERVYPRGYGFAHGGRGPSHARLLRS